ncbi:hypothetical protein [Rubripirellula reticaptiva]|uniref:Nucleotide-diphospho-sugar transferase n=1 Tax=Rubripirellula reticaptiva TaxID=2528013 RepID=A0A5C6FE49_9BACT|nr:hypothetical protein [Rubripirellula reticaptiva]TWU57841.1 hypothetical protein Poly59_07500 [Rubripirellula reticaptiva]
MSMPIIFVHSGKAEHLYIATRQARISNPDADVVLIGDSSNQRLKWPTQHYQIDDYNQDIRQFQAHYRHRSPNPPSFEMFCFERWFVVAKWMREHHVDKAWVCDSDLMIFSDLKSIAKKFASFDLGISFISGHSLMINRLDCLDGFCDFINRMYADPDQQQKFDDLFANSPSIWDRSISDMTALTHYTRTIPDRVIDLATIQDSSVFDFHIRHLDGFAGKKSKQIDWRDSKPFGVHPDHTDPIRFHTLHFQGRAKQSMHAYASNPDLDVWTSWLRRRTTTRLAKLKKYLPSACRKVA